MVRKYSKLLQEIKGVTISELIIDLTIVSILVVFATSTYSNYATRTKIANQVSLLHMLVKCINLKKDGKDFYLDFNHSMINDYGVITKNIGESELISLKGMLKL